MALLESSAVVMHPFVAGEIACGSLAHRSTALNLLQDLPLATLADKDEVRGFSGDHGPYST